ncbi:MAG: hypothetical protein ACTHMM_25090 [Agriterribacter sp.]
MEMAGALWGKYAILFCVFGFLFFGCCCMQAFCRLGMPPLAAVGMTMTAVGFQLSPISLQRRVARLLFCVLVLRFLFLTV